MPTYKVRRYFEVYDTIEVEASSFEEAAKKAAELESTDLGDWTDTQSAFTGMDVSTDEGKEAVESKEGFAYIFFDAKDIETLQP